MPQLAPFPPTTAVSRRSIPLQIAVEESRLRFPRPPLPMLLRSEEMRAIFHSMTARGPSCIACRLLCKPHVLDHSLRACTACPNPLGAHKEQYGTFVVKVQKCFPPGTCFQCGCPQHVSPLLWSRISADHRFAAQIHEPGRITPTAPQLQRLRALLMEKHISGSCMACAH